MATLKCKMCGGDMNIESGATVAVCEYCETKQTVPSADDDKKMSLYQRAHKLRFNCEFDKAAGVYESIIADFAEEAEAYWGLVLCKYGIEYVDDPASGNKVPTCHRSSFDSIFDDSDFEQVLENADPTARGIYRQEAKKIEELRKGIIEVSGKEEPYDIFICYKETDDNGNRTVDSLIAQDVYDALTEKGYRVFFSRITLEEKLGQEYEPYIFAALNSAKIMLAFGTDYEYYNSVWVKNEWSRFLQLIAKGGKKTLIPCYKGIDVYDMPKEFARLQAQDMGKVGALQDLLRGIEKIIPKGEINNDRTGAAAQNISQTATVDTLLKRAYMYLEDKDWQNAEDYCDRVLDITPENATAYIGKLMAEMHVSQESELGNLSQRINRNTNFKWAVNYGDADTVRRLNEYEEADEARIGQREAQKKAQLQEAVGKIQKTVAEADKNLKKAEETCKAYETQAELKKNSELLPIEKQLRDKQMEVVGKKVAASGKKSRNPVPAGLSMILIILTASVSFSSAESITNDYVGNVSDTVSYTIMALFIATALVSAAAFSIGRPRAILRIILSLLSYFICWTVLCALCYVTDLVSGDAVLWVVVAQIFIFNLINIIGIRPKSKKSTREYDKLCAELEQIKSQYDTVKASVDAIEIKLEESRKNYNQILSEYKNRLHKLNGEYKELAKEANVVCENLIPIEYL